MSASEGHSPVLLLTPWKRSLYLLHLPTRPRIIKILKINTDVDKFMYMCQEYETNQRLLQYPSPEEHVEKIETFARFENIQYDSYLPLTVEGHHVEIPMAFFISSERSFQQRYHDGKICIMVLSYSEKKDLYSILRKSPHDEDIIHYLQNVLSKYTQLYEWSHFTHGDLKLDNIVISPSSHHCTFIDCEFSEFVKNASVTVEDEDIPRLNLYLKFSVGIKIPQRFFYLFDILLLNSSVYDLFQSFSTHKYESLFEYIEQNLQIPTETFAFQIKCFLMYQFIRFSPKKDVLELNHHTFLLPFFNRYKESMFSNPLYISVVWYKDTCDWVFDVLDEFYVYNPTLRNIL